MRLPPRLFAAALALSSPAIGQDDHAHGRALFIERGCVHCHGEDRQGPLSAQSPRGPDLRKIGARLSGAWMARWLLDPSAAHGQARMPDLFDDSRDGKQDAADVAAHLASRGGAFKRDDVDWHKRNGERLFVVRGCVACHRTGREAEDGRWLLTALGEKTGPKQLADYLQNPLRHHPRGLMPDLQLSRGDSEALAGWLLGDSAIPTAQAPAGDAKRGAELVVAKRCYACHDSGDVASPAPPLATLADKTGGCLADQPERGLPRYGWSEDSRRAVVTFLRNASAPEPAAVELDRRLAQLRCVACHEHGDAGGMPPQLRTLYHGKTQADSADHADPPTLTDLHDKLRPDWVDDVLLHKQRARPYMKIRMPHYPPQLTGGLARLLAGSDEIDAPAVADRLEDIDHGRELVGFTGFSCVICHDFAGRAANGSRAPDLANAHRRLRPAFLQRWLTDPSAVHPGTRMPTYFQGGKSSATHILGGEATAQVRAITAYLAQGHRATPPNGMALLTDTVVHATAQPIVMRTILPELDPRSIALGFPQGLSVALDVAEPRLGYVWQGGFLNLRRKWTGRGNGPCDLVGAKLIDGAPGAMFRRGDTPLDAEFAGYRFEGEAVVANYALEDASVEIGFDVVRSEVAFGLRLDISSECEQVVEVVLGRRAAPRIVRRGQRALVELEAIGEARCFLRSASLVDDATPRVVVPANGGAEAILWFPTTTSDDVVQTVLRWNE